MRASNRQAKPTHYANDRQAQRCRGTFCGRAAMLWVYAAAGGFGLLLGLRYRVAAVGAASVMLVMASIVAATLAGWSLWMTFAMVFGGTFALQCGYLLGLMVMCAATQAKVSSHLMPPTQEHTGADGQQVERPDIAAQG